MIHDYFQGLLAELQFYNQLRLIIMYLGDCKLRINHLFIRQGPELQIIWNSPLSEIKKKKLINSTNDELQYPSTGAKREIKAIDQKLHLTLNHDK